MNTASAEAGSNADFYRARLDHAGNQFAAVFGAMHDAPPGTVLIHCHLGKDRTGLVTALALELCGVPRAQIAADYEQTTDHLGEFYVHQLERQSDPDKRAKLATFQVSREEDMLAALEHLDARWNGAAAYLEAFGFERSEQKRLVRRLV